MSARRWKISGTDVLDAFIDSYPGESRPLIEGLHAALDDPLAVGDPWPGRPLGRVFTFGEFVVLATVAEQFHVVHIVAVVAA